MLKNINQVFIAINEYKYIYILINYIKNNCIFLVLTILLKFNFFFYI